MLTVDGLGGYLSEMQEFKRKVKNFSKSHKIVNLKERYVSIPAVQRKATRVYGQRWQSETVSSMIKRNPARPASPD